MAIEYPDVIPSFPSKVNGDILDAITDYNDVTGELTAALTELGVLPKGAYADVVARLDAQARQGLNYAVNAGLEFWQGGNSFPNLAVGSYGPDQWKVAVKAGATPPIVNVDRISAGAGPVVRGQRACRLAVTAGVTSPIWEFHQPFALQTSRQFGGFEMTFSMDVDTTISGKVRLGLADAIGTTLGSFHGGTGVERLFVRRTIQVLSGSFTLKLIFNPADFTTTIDIDSAMLSIGKSALFVPISHELELARVQRYFEKSFDQEVNPGASTIGAEAQRHFANSFDSAVGFRMTKLTIPTIVIFNTVTGTISSIRNTSAGTNFAVGGIQFVGQRGFNVFSSAGPASVGQECAFQWTADARL